MNYLFIKRNISGRQSGLSLAVNERLGIFNGLGVRAHILTLDFDVRMFDYIKENSGVTNSDVINMYVELTGVDFVKQKINVVNMEADDGTLIQKNYFDEKGQLRITDYYSGDAHRTRLFKRSFFSPEKTEMLTLLFDDDQEMSHVTLLTSIGYVHLSGEFDLIRYYMSTLDTASNIIFSDLVSDRDVEGVAAGFDGKIVSVIHSDHYLGNFVRPGYRYSVLGTGISHIIVSTEQQKHDIQQIRPELQISVVPPIVLNERLPMDDTKKIAGRITVVSRIDPVKRFEDMIKATVLAKEKFPILDLHLIGDIVDDAYARRLRELIKENNATTYIFIDDPTVYVDAKYAISELTLMTSKHEGFARTVVEAMNQGVVPISYPVKYGPTDVIKHNVNGIVTSSASVAELAARIIDVMSDKDRMKRMANRAVETAQNFHRQQVENKWREIIASLEKA